jgi:hypothetical protein
LNTNVSTIWKRWCSIPAQWKPKIIVRAYHTNEIAMQHSPLVNSISDTYRRRRFAQFLRILSVSPSDKILDVGGTTYFWAGSGLEQNVTLFNVTLPDCRPVPYIWVQGDACQMSMFADQSFDVVFSNSVIEHVGNFGRQQQMANEIRRVGKRYWVQTPYKHFPIEPHFIFPFFQYLPDGLRIEVAKHWPLSFAKRQGRDPTIDARTIWLLDRCQFQALFPEAQLEVETFLGLTKALLVYKA